jgi:hypothetical protein
MVEQRKLFILVNLVAGISGVILQMIERTNEEKVPEKVGMYISILNDVVLLVNRIVVNENDRIRLLEVIRELDDKAERSIRKGLLDLGNDFMDR